MRRGAVAASGNGRAVNIDAGQQVRFQNENSLQHTALKAPAPDGFDDRARVAMNGWECFALGRSSSASVLTGRLPYHPQLGDLTY